MPVTLQVDASAAAVGGALLQDNQPVAFYSNTLTGTEQRCAIIEKECLAICLAFRNGSVCFTESQISFVVNYKKGAQLVIAATLLRAPEPHLSAAYLSGEHIFRVELETMTLDNSGISNVTLENLQEQTARDPELQRLSFLIMTGWPTDKRKLDPSVRPYLTFKDKLSLADSV